MALADDAHVLTEVVTVGLAGMVGLSLFLRAGGNPHAAFCQRAGPATRLGADDLRRALSHDPQAVTGLDARGRRPSLIRSTRGIVTIIGRARPRTHRL
ncbi:MAG: hypothetical protein LC721_12280 [Actinobacteria bacterium]|nr:hypothetical protein [Actinomycetota bacterium]